MASAAPFANVSANLALQPNTTSASTSAVPISGPLPAQALAAATATAPAPAPRRASVQAQARPTPSTSSRSQSRDATEHNGPPSLVSASDGRVRNPVPSKLKGKADNRNGNFGVMHMALTRPELSERDAAARRTSEGTAAAAKLASKDGYQSIKRSKLVWHPPEPEQRPPSNPTPSNAQPILPMAPSPSPTPVQQQQQQQQPPPQQPQQQQQQPMGPSPLETKSEQARLLTLLRTLNPVQVVDQLCKALAYFGGIPSAPPPANGQFPESSRAHGSGSLLVGWMSEIFPHVEGSQAFASTPTAPSHPVTAPVNSVTDTTETPVPAKRARGRPKGSKSTKVRKDKGLKKTGQASGKDASGAQTTSDPVLASEDGVVPVEPDVSQSQDMTGEIGQLQTPRAPGLALTSGQINPDSSIMSTPGSKKRGRPKGSKNRPKPAAETAPGAPLSNETAQALDQTQAEPDSPTKHKSQSSLSKQKSPQGGSNSLISQLQDQRGEIAAPTTSASQPSQFGLSTPTSLDTQSAPPWTITGVPDSRPGQQPDSLIDHGVRKRKSFQSTADCDQGLATFASGILNASELGGVNGNPTQGAQTKRRRVSKETIQSTGLPGMDVHAAGINTAGAPMLNPSFGGNSRPMSTSGAFDSGTPVTSLDGSTSLKSPAQRIPEKQQQRSDQFGQHQTAQHQQHYQKQQLSPLGNAGSSMQHGAVAMPRSRHQQSSPYSTPQQVNSAQQNYYAQQRQPTNQFGQLGNAGSNFGQRGMAVKPSPFPQNMTRQPSTDGNSGMAGMARQASVSTSRAQQARAATAHHPGSFGSQQSPSSSSPSSSLNQFQSFQDQSYLNMDYVMNGRGVNDSSNTANPNFPGQLEALTDTNLRDRMY